MAGYGLYLCVSRKSKAAVQMKNRSHEVEKITATIEEIDASFNFIALGLKSLREQKSSISNNHVVLQLFSSGFERLIKILLLVKEKHVTGSYPELRSFFKNYSNGHGIEAMLNELLNYRKTVELTQLIPMAKEDFEFIETDKFFREFLKIVTEFSIRQRYYYIDTIVADKSNLDFNPFDQFKVFITSFGEGVDLSKLTYKEEEEFLIHEAIVCIEKGVRGISRFFSHCLGDLGRGYYQDFSNFIFLNNKDLGKLKYTEKKRLPAEDYIPIESRSFSFLKISLSSRSKMLYAYDYGDWAFTVDKIKVYFLSGNFYFLKIKGKIFALTGKTSSHYKIPTYFSSKSLKPKAYALYLLEEAKRLK